MKPRITINANDRGELEIWLNSAGRDLLVHALQTLSVGHEHFHLMPEGHGSEVPLQCEPYNKGDHIYEWGKVLFRPDEWDAEHFPHLKIIDSGNDS